MTHEPEKSDLFIRVIAIFKLFKAILMITLAIGVLHYVNRNVQAAVENLLDHLRVDPDNKVAQWCVEKSGELTHTRMITISEFAFVYSALLTAEGVGLYLRKRWAEYLVVVMTCMFLPLEVDALWHAPTWPKALLLTGNLAIVGYLIHVLLTTGKRAKEKAPSS